MEKLPIYHVVFPNRRTMNLAIGRVSEYGENPVFRRRVFTWDELERWWKEHTGGKKGRFVDYWDGFNIPVSEFRPFVDGTFADLNAREKALLKMVRRMPARSYVIATAQKTGVLSHEVVHGLFYQDRAYRREVERAVGEAMRRKRIPRIIAALTRMGYAPHTHVDEANAYLTIHVEGSERMLGPGERKLRAELRGILRRHFGSTLRGKDGERFAAALVHRVPFVGPRA